jgi:hypothetical protein
MKRGKVARGIRTVMAKTTGGIKTVQNGGIGLGNACL